MMRILNIQRMSTEDGPGLRTTVFLKGCSLKCTWCHNPESIPYAIDKEWIKSSCIYCLECVNICPNQAITYENDEIKTNKDLCNLCLKCADACPTKAMRQIGEDISVEKLFKEIIKDKAYFQHDGGITFSGGEVLIQSKEVALLCQLLKKENIHIAIDTAGFVDFSKFEEVLPYVDLVLYDIKLLSKEDHLKYCKADNDIILDNLLKLSKYDIKIWIRTPIIPDATDSISNIESIALFIKNNLISFNRWELCTFNNLCLDKYHRLGKTWDFEDKKLITKTKMEELLVIAKNVLVTDSKNIFISGATKLEESI